MAKDLEMGYLLDFYGEVLTQKQREMLRQYYNDDLSLSEIGENFGITRQGARDAIKHGETTLKELEEKVGFAARYRRVQQKLEQLEQHFTSRTISRMRTSSTARMRSYRTRRWLLLDAIRITSYKCYLSSRDFSALRSAGLTLIFPSRSSVTSSRFTLTGTSDFSGMTFKSPVSGLVSQTFALVPSCMVTTAPTFGVMRSSSS